VKTPIPTIRRLLPLLLGAQLLIALPARAAEDERFTALHGTICRPIPEFGVTLTPPLITTAGIGNTDPTGTMKVECPIPMVSRTKNTFLSAKHSRDASGNFVGKCQTDTTDTPWVEVYDRSGSSDVSCTLFVLGDGNAVVSSFTETTFHANSGPAVKIFFPVNSRLMMSERNRLYVQCTVPPRGTGDFSYVARFGIATCEGDPP
jgi:hypothetical protein